jgi:hypothetical protein
LRDVAIVNAQTVLRRALSHRAVFFRQFPMSFGFLHVIHDAILAASKTSRLNFREG